MLKKENLIRFFTDTNKERSEIFKKTESIILFLILRDNHEEKWCKQFRKYFKKDINKPKIKKKLEETEVLNQIEEILGNNLKLYF